MITIVGLGALGSHVALFLREVGHGLALIDFDKVEMKNTQAQFHTNLGVRKNKAYALQQALRGMFGHSTLAVPNRLTEDNPGQLLGGADLVLDCTDNIATREIIKNFSRANDKPCLHGCLSADGTFARIVWTENFTPDAEGADGEATCIGGEHLPFFALAASTMAVEVQRFLNTGKKSNFHVGPYGALRI